MLSVRSDGQIILISIWFALVLTSLVVIKLLFYLCFMKDNEIAHFIEGIRIWQETEA